MDRDGLLPATRRQLAGFLKLTGVKPAPTPMTRATETGVRNALDVLASDDALTFRRGTGIAMYIGHDRCDAQCTIEGLASDVQNPTRRALHVCEGWCDTSAARQMEASVSHTKMIARA